MCRHNDAHIAGLLGSQRAPHDPLSKILLFRNPRDVAARAQQAHPQDSYPAPLCHKRYIFPHSCLTLLSRRVNKLTVDCPLMADKLQNRVTLEKLKSRSVIAGTRSLPVSDVIASTGLVKAAIRLKTRSGL